MDKKIKPVSVMVTPEGRGLIPVVKIFFVFFRNYFVFSFLAGPFVFCVLCLLMFFTGAIGSEMQIDSTMDFFKAIYLLAPPFFDFVFGSLHFITAGSAEGLLAVLLFLFSVIGGTIRLVLRRLFRVELNHKFSVKQKFKIHAAVLFAFLLLGLISISTIPVASGSDRFLFYPIMIFIFLIVLVMDRIYLQLSEWIDSFEGLFRLAEHNI